MDEVIEVLEYKNVPYSQFGFQWVLVGEMTVEEAEEYIEQRVTAGTERSNFRTREKITPRTEEKRSTYFRISNERRIDNLSATKKKRRWDEGNPV